ncbi:hypothetical protein Sste5346_003701 [Sporothrix stenoceras]|uniref:Uncharacterized protein n=1 Tax=Sporothrix stenoceras TaxID=5173 RepID=A0ABR3ZB98_9PEZI
MVAAAALLSYIKRARVGGVSSLVRLVEMSVEILDAMDESVVARKCAEILKRHLREVDDTVNNCGALVPFGQIGAPSDGETLLPSADTDFEVLNGAKVNPAGYSDLKGCPTSPMAVNRLQRMDQWPTLTSDLPGAVTPIETTIIVQ